MTNFRQKPKSGGSFGHKPSGPGGKPKFFSGSKGPKSPRSSSSYKPGFSAKPGLSSSSKPFKKSGNFKPFRKNDEQSEGYEKRDGFKPSFGDREKRSDFSSDRKKPFGKPGYSSSRPGYSFGKPFNKGGKPFKRRDSDSSEGNEKRDGFRQSFGDRERSYGNRERSYGDRERSYGDRERTYGDRERKFDAPYSGERKKPFGKPGGSKPFGFKKNFGGGQDFKPKRFGKFQDSERPSDRFEKRYDRRDSEGFVREEKFEKPDYEKRVTESSEESSSAPAFKPVRAPFKSRSYDDGPSEGKKYIPGSTAKKLIVTLKDTKTVPIRLVWVFDSMVESLPDGEPNAGDTVHVHDSQDRFIGSAIYNPNSKIRARIFSVSKQLFSDPYIKEALEKAVELRKTMGYLTGSCRVVFGEADGLPGLIADKIGDYLVIQSLTYAVDKRIGRITDLLNELVCPTGIIVRNDVPIREKEGLEVGPPVMHGDIPERVTVFEENCKLYADPAGGQKTGMFLDQRLNRATIKPFAKDARVLDLFCHVGGWSMRAASYGAKEVIGVDSSRPALDLAEAAARDNGFTQATFQEADVFDYLRALPTDEESLFDIIICDPPAFAKTKAHFEDAFRAYLSLNYLAMKRLKPNGILVSCSCSQALSGSDFSDALVTSARNARMQFQVLEKRGAPADHPVLLGLSESYYLKCFILKRTE